MSARSGFRRPGDHVLAPDGLDLLESFGEQCAPGPRARPAARRASGRPATRPRSCRARSSACTPSPSAATSPAGCWGPSGPSARRRGPASTRRQRRSGSRTARRCGCCGARRRPPRCPSGHRFAFEEFPVFADALRAGRPEFVTDLETDGARACGSATAGSAARARSCGCRWPGAASARSCWSSPGPSARPRPPRGCSRRRPASRTRPALTLVQARRRQVEREARRLHERLELGLLPQIVVPEALARRLAVDRALPARATRACGSAATSTTASRSAATGSRCSSATSPATAPRRRRSARACAPGSAPSHCAAPHCRSSSVALEQLLLAERTSDEAFATVCAATVDAAGARRGRRGRAPPAGAVRGRRTRRASSPCPPRRRSASGRSRRVATASERQPIVLQPRAERRRSCSTPTASWRGRSAGGAEARWGLAGLLRFASDVVAARRPRTRSRRWSRPRRRRTGAGCRTTSPCSL